MYVKEIVRLNFSISFATRSVRVNPATLFPRRLFSGRVVGGGCGFLAQPAATNNKLGKKRVSAKRGFLPFFRVIDYRRED